jgi:hypothetical protein
MEIVKSQHEGEKEGRDGRIRTRQVTEWVVVDDDGYPRSFERKRDAVDYVKRHAKKAE